MTLPDREPPTSGPYRSARTLAKWVTGSFVVYLAADAYIMVMSLEGLDVIGTLQSGGDVSPGRLLALGDKLQNLSTVMYGALLVTIVAFCMWTYRVASNAAAAFGARTPVTPGWAVGYYFIPFINMWRPYQALGDVWRGSDPKGGEDDSRFASIAAPLPWFFITWWLTWLASRLVERIAISKFESVETFVDTAGGFRWLMIAAGIDIVAVVLCLMVTWKLTHRQDRRAEGALPRARIVDQE